MKKTIWFLATCFLVCSIAKAQMDLQNTGVLHISSGTDTLYINGNFTNTPTAVFTNNGWLQIKQNFTNDQSSMAAGTGTLYLNGSAAQSVNGSQSFKTYNLVTNNSAGITLNNNLSVSAVHTFTSGLITTSATPNYLVYEAGSSYTGNGDSRHVTGWVKKLGSTNFTFPIGDATYERTAGVTNLSAASEICCHYYINTQNVINLFSPLVNVKANEYWQIDKLSGGTVQIALNWDHTKVPMDNVILADILTGYYTGGKWTDAGGSGTASGAVTATGSVTSSAASSFGSFTFGYTSFPIPLKLISFSGERRAGTIFLYWITENEQNVDHFEVQRSYDAVTYTTIGNVIGRNTSSRQYYNFEDHAPSHGFVWYRLRCVDADGKFSYSRIVVVAENKFENSSFTVLNPSRLAITVFNNTGTTGRFEYRLFNAGGQLVLKGNTSMTVNGGTVLPLPVSSVPGIYVLELSNKNIQFREKIMVEK